MKSIRDQNLRPIRNLFVKDLANQQDVCLQMPPIVPGGTTSDKIHDEALRES